MLVITLGYRLAYREGRQCSTNTLLKDSMRVLQKAIYQLLSLLERKAVLSRLGPNSLKEYLNLTLTLFVNTIMLQPTSLPISKFLQLNKGLKEILKRKWKIQFDYKTICINIQQASCTSDFFKIIEYLLCPSRSSGRYEALTTIVRRRRGLEMIQNSLSDEEVRTLPSVKILGIENIPRVSHNYTRIAIITFSTRI